jgi:Ni,Fe-hydrogenase maturation factor
MIRIYTLGNLLLEEDKLALEVAEALQGRISGIEFVEFDPIETVEGDVWFMDVVKGIKDVLLVEDACFDRQKVYSMHDFDLSHMLAMLKKAGKVKSFKMVAIPFGMDKDEAIEKVSKLLKPFST